MSELDLFLHSEKYVHVMNELVLKRIRDNFSYHGNELVCHVQANNYTVSHHLVNTVHESSELVILGANEMSPLIETFFQCSINKSEFNDQVMQYGNFLGSLSSQGYNRAQIIDHIAKSVDRPLLQETLTQIFFQKCSFSEIENLSALYEYSNIAFLVLIEHKILVVLGPLMFVHIVFDFFGDRSFMPQVFKNVKSLLLTQIVPHKISPAIKGDNVKSIFQLTANLDSQPNVRPNLIPITIRESNGFFRFVGLGVNNIQIVGSFLLGGIAAYNYQKLVALFFPNKIQVVGNFLGKIFGQEAVLALKIFSKSFFKGVFSSISK